MLVRRNVGEADACEEKNAACGELAFLLKTKPKPSEAAPIWYGGFAATA